MPVHPFVKKAQMMFKDPLQRPLWFDTVTVKYPPIQFQTKSKAKPAKIKYPEDKLKLKFYKEYPLEAQRPMHLDESQPITSRDLGLPSFMATARSRLDEGYSLEEAYRIAQLQFNREKAKREIEKKVMMEQSLAEQSAFSEPSNLLLNETFLREEQKILKKLKEDSKNEWSRNFKGRK